MDEIYSILRGLSPREKMKVLGYLEGELLYQVAEEEKNKKNKKNKIVEFPKKKWKKKACAWALAPQAFNSFCGIS